MKKYINYFINSDKLVPTVIRFILAVLLFQNIFPLFITQNIFPLININGPSLNYSRAFAFFSLVLFIISYVVYKNLVFRDFRRHFMKVFIKYAVAILFLTIISGTSNSFILKSCAKNLIDINSLSTCKESLYVFWFSISIIFNLVLSFTVLRVLVFKDKNHQRGLDKFRHRPR